MKWLLMLPALAACFTAARPALAQSCSATATGLAFGNYQPLAGLAATTTATVTVTCNPGAASVAVSYSVSLSAGGSGTYVARRLTGPGGNLGYQIFKDVLLTQVFGDGTGGSTNITDGYLLGLLLPVVRNYPVYGDIPANERVGVGSFTDSIIVLITF